MKVELISYTVDPVWAVEHAASNCYDSTPTGDGKLFNNCMKSGHTAVAEFAHFNFRISGVSRALMAQLTRHRHASFAIRSQRYCNESEAEFVTPDTIANSKFAEEYNKVTKILFDFYDNMVKEGIPAEDARYILPNSCCTTIEMSMNFRELMQFCNLRLCNRAQWEIRRMTKMLVKEVVNVMPEAEKYLVPSCEKYAPYYFCTEARSCGRRPKLKDIIH